MKIEQSLLNPVIEWTLLNFKKFTINSVSSHRYYKILHCKDLNPPLEVWKIKKSIYDKYNLYGLKLEPIYMDYCSVITENGAIHPHKDPTEKNKIHVRFNVMVSKPIAGGLPVQEGKIIEVSEGEVWQTNASKVEHWSTPVEGDKPRIVLSYGVLM